MLSKVQKMIRDERGGFLIIGAIALPFLLAIVGGAIDFSRYNYINSKFQTSTDTALLAAAATARTNPNLDEVALKFFNANFPAGYSRSLILQSIDVETDGENMQWTATAKAEIETNFGSFMGLGKIPVEHTVTVAWDISKRVEAIFTVDTSASMCMDVERTPIEDGAFKLEYKPDYRCKKLNAMKESMQYVIEHGMAPIEGIDGPSFHAGIVPFNHKVRFPDADNIPAPLRKAEETLAKGDPEYFKNLEDAEPLAPIIPLKAINTDNEKAEMSALIEGIKQSPTGKGWTRSNIATLTAALMLDPEHYTSFGGDEPAEINPDKTEKIIVMMTDGANVGCCYAAHQEGNFDNQYLYLYKADNAHLIGHKHDPELAKWADQYGMKQDGLCEQLKAADYTVYSVVYDVDDGDPGGQAIKDVYRGCASNDQFFFDVQDEDDLRLAYKTIAQSLLKLRIVK